MVVHVLLLSNWRNWFDQFFESRPVSSKESTSGVTVVQLMQEFLELFEYQQSFWLSQNDCV